jgi:hypothetical protein
LNFSAFQLKIIPLSVVVSKKFLFSVIASIFNGRWHGVVTHKNCDSIVLYPRWLPFVEKLFLIDKSQLQLYFLVKMSLNLN